jgi:hypothetical protein
MIPGLALDTIHSPRALAPSGGNTGVKIGRNESRFVKVRIICLAPHLTGGMPDTPEKLVRSISGWGCW